MASSAFPSPEEVSDLSSWKAYYERIVEILQEIDPIADIRSFQNLVKHMRLQAQLLPNRLQISLYTFLSTEIPWIPLTGQILYKLHNCADLMTSSLKFNGYYLLLMMHWDPSELCFDYTKSLSYNSAFCDCVSSNVCKQNLWEQHTSQDMALNLLKVSLALISNITRNTQLGSTFRSNVAMKNFLILQMQSNNKTNHTAYIKCISLVVAAFLLNDSELNKLQQNFNAVGALLDFLCIAIKESDRRFEGFSPTEILSALAVLTINSQISSEFVTHNGVHHLKQILQSLGNEPNSLNSELVQASKILWNLSLDKACRERLIKQHQLQEFLENILNLIKSNEKNHNFDSSFFQLRKNVCGTIWTLRNTNESSSPHMFVVKQKPTEKKSEQVFISYSWSDKIKVYKVRDQLRKDSICCWIDVEQMQGSTLEAMSSGIDASQVFLLCISESYKQSANCRMEAEYAFTQGKTILPLILQPQYKPDGWLGILLGAKLYFDFSGRRSFDQVYANFRAQLEVSGVFGADNEQSSIQPVNVTVNKTNKTLPESLDFSNQKLSNEQQVDPKRVYKFTSSIDKKLISIKNMDSLKIRNWLTSRGLEAFVSITPNFTGQHLVELVKIKYCAPQFLYSTLESRLRLDIKTILEFSKLADELIN